MAPACMARTLPIDDFLTLPLARPWGHGPLAQGHARATQYSRGAQLRSYLYKYASVQFCRSKDQLGSQAGVPERQMAGPNPQKGPTNIPKLL